MNALRRHVLGGDSRVHKYTLIGSQNASSKTEVRLWTRKRSLLIIMLVALVSVAVVLISGYVRILY